MTIHIAQIRRKSVFVLKFLVDCTNFIMTFLFFAHMTHVDNTYWTIYVSTYAEIPMTQPFFCTFSFNTYDAFILRPPVTHFTFIWWRITFPVDIRYLLTIEVVHTYLFIETHSPPRIWNNLRSFLKTGIKFGWKHRKEQRNAQKMGNNNYFLLFCECILSDFFANHIFA